MKQYIKFRILLAVLAIVLFGIDAKAISLWVGESYTWDFGGSVLGSTYNMSVTSDGGYLSITGTGFYRKITPTQYFSGTATVTAEWDYTLYYGDTKRHQKVTLSISCNENPVYISPSSVTLSPGQTYQLSYGHEHNNNPYVGYANVYFTGGNSSFSVSQSGLITAKSPGSGYVNVYSKISSAANAPSCYVTVVDIEPAGASISDVSILADQSTDLAVTVSPSNATIKSSQWYVEKGEDVVSISGSRLTGLKPGTATIYCMVNGTVRSNSASVTVIEPKLTSIATDPLDGAIENSVFINPSVTYSHAISEGTEFNSIALTENGNKKEGSVKISGNQVKFIPSKPLNPKTEYLLSIPRNAIKNKWGSPAQSDVVLSFKTGPLEKSTVSMNPLSGSYLTRNDVLTLSSYPSDAIIYYTLDGTTPNTTSSVYTEPIKVDGDFTIKAFCVREGYEDSDIVTAEYYKSQSEIVEYYPNDNNPLFNYSLVSPYLKLSGSVEVSNNFRKISLKDATDTAIEGEAFITNNMIVFVPTDPLENCKTYTVDIPRDAVKTTQGEVFRGFTWSFTTPNMLTNVMMQGDETLFVLSENGLLKTRGMEYVTTTPADGSYTFKDYGNLTYVLSDVDDIACGFTHRLVRRGSTVTGYGMAYCGETGTSSTIVSIGNIKELKAGFQTSAIIGEDNSLWMCGRNDFYQLGDGSGTTTNSFIKVADNVIDVALGNGYSLYVDSDNILWGVGRNHRGQLGDGSTQNQELPVKIMEGVSKVYASISGFFSACVTVDNQLMTWGDNAYGQLGRDAEEYSSTPAVALNDVMSASLGEAHMLAVTNGYKLFSWGSNSYDQISNLSGNITEPALMAENILDVSAGPHTSLILSNTGKITGWGRKSHSNFGSGEGFASDFVVDEGRACEALQDVRVEPFRFEAKPDKDFAFVAISEPYVSDYEFVEWTSDNPDVATVEGNGIIHTGKLGEATVTVKFTDRFGTSKEAYATVVCTETPDNTGVGDIIADSSDWYVNTDKDAIIIENATLGACYTVYSVQGIVVTKTIATDNRIMIPVNHNTPYIVRSGAKAVKVICN